MSETDTSPIVGAPLTISSESEVKWSEAADLVVVGFGIAGAAAGIQAVQNGADALILDRFGSGGATAYSGGVLYAGDTVYQRDAGVQDDIEEMYKYLSLELGGIVKPETIRRFCAQSAGNLDWLVSLGINFEGSLHPGKTSYPDEDKYLYYSGNEKVASFAKTAKPAPRGHRAKGKGWTGYKLFDGLKAAAEKIGVRCSPHTRATRLVVDTSGTVLGVAVLHLGPQHHEAHQAFCTGANPYKPFNTRRVFKYMAAARKMEERYGVEQYIRARLGVVLATGGYSYNMPMLKQAMPRVHKIFSSVLRLATIGNDGSGILLGKSVGGVPDHMGNKAMARTMIPPVSCIHGIIVNNSGRRFINEDAYSSTLGSAMLDQPDLISWLIVDNTTFWSIIQECMPNFKGTFLLFGAPTMMNILFGGTKRGRSLAALSKKCGFPTGALDDEVAQLNAAIDAGAPDPMGKDPSYSHRFGAGPYWALNNKSGNPFLNQMFFGLGGLRVNEETGHVLDQSGVPITGLFAAGRDAVGLCSNSYISGMALSDGVFSGRRAGNSATDEQLITKVAQ